MRLVPTPRPSVEAVAAGPWTPVDDVAERLDKRFRMIADHALRADYDLGARATINDTHVCAFRTSFRLTTGGQPDAFRLDHLGSRAARSSWTTSFRLRTCVLAELHDPVPNLRISNRAIQDLQPTVFDRMRRVRGTSRRFRKIFSARTSDREFAREVLNDQTCSLLLAEPAFSCLECRWDQALFVFDGDASRDHAVAFAVSFVDQLRAVTTGTGSARVRVLDA